MRYCLRYSYRQLMERMISCSSRGAAEILTCCREEAHSSKCILLYGYMSTEYTRDHNKWLWGPNVLEHQQLHRNQWAPRNPSTWHQMELIFFAECLWGPCGLSSTHQQDLPRFGAVMCWNENHLWRDTEVEEGLKKSQCQNETSGMF